MIRFVFLMTLLLIIIILLLKAGKTKLCLCGIGILLLFFAFAVVLKLFNTSGVPVVLRHSTKEIPSGSIDAVPPVWLPDIEDQFEADVYPSRLSANRAIGLRTKGHPSVTASAVGIETHPPPWSGKSETRLNSGRIEATITDNNKQTIISANFVEKPWVENFAEFVNRNPKEQWLLARSQQSCTSQAEAEHQAIRNACDKVTSLLSQMPRQGHAIGPGPTVTAADIRNGNFIVDRFAQSFAGTAGRIWRQAILINASQDKLTNLARQKTIIRQSWRASFLRDLFSIVGILIVICVVYLFLNAATKGYYTWSLRIAAVVLVLLGISLLLMLS
jgi:hypothetical protein